MAKLSQHTDMDKLIIGASIDSHIVYHGLCICFPTWLCQYNFEEVIAGVFLARPTRIFHVGSQHIEVTKLNKNLETNDPWLCFGIIHLPFIMQYTTTSPILFLLTF
jgi:hypothetical protein